MTFLQGDQIQTGFISTPGTSPLILEPCVEDVNLIKWALANQELLEDSLHKYGGILFRNFSISSASEFEFFLKTITGELLVYQYASTPRSQVSGRIYSSTEYPAEQVIPLHNEESYASSWPMRLGFFCLQSAPSGGETPIADSRQVYCKITKSIRERFVKKNVMYIRKYGTGLDLSWESAFNTKDKSAVELYCREAGIEFEWHENNVLRTIQVCQATAIHPHTHEPVWFNQAHLFHISNLPRDIRETLLECVREKDLPRQAYYGDGTPLELEVLDEIRQVYHEQTILFHWQEKDILLIDNMLTAHGRLPFAGPRKILVGMTTPYRHSGEFWDTSQHSPNC